MVESPRNLDSQKRNSNESENESTASHGRLSHSSTAGSLKRGPARLPRYERLTAWSPRIAYPPFLEKLIRRYLPGKEDCNLSRNWWLRYIEIVIESLSHEIYKCQEPGHMSRECKNQVRCARCHGERHWASRCPAPASKNSQSQTHANRPQASFSWGEKEVDTHFPYSHYSPIYIIAKVGGVGPQTLMIDCGASGNCISMEKAKHLGLPIAAGHMGRVKIGDASTMKILGLARDVPVIFQNAAPMPLTKQSLTNPLADGYEETPQSTDKSFFHDTVPLLITADMCLKIN